MTDPEPKETQGDAPPRDPLLEQTNDTTALNGGPARHWFREGAREASPTPRRRAKLISAIFVWTALAATVLLLLAGLR